MRDTLSSTISDLEEQVSALEEAKTEDVDDATNTLDTVAHELRSLADDLDRMSNSLADARNVLSVTKITRLTHANVLALRECFPEQVRQGFLVLGATTAEWPTHVSAEALIQVETMMGKLPTRGHPRASLHAVARKLRKLI